MLAVAGDGSLGELGIALLQRVEALRQQPLGQAAHLRDLLVEQLQLLVEGLDDVLVHAGLPRLQSAGLSLLADRTAKHRQEAVVEASCALTGPIGHLLALGG